MIDIKSLDRDADKLIESRAADFWAHTMETLKTRAHFQRVQKGRKWVTSAFILHGRLRDADKEGGQSSAPRFGFTVSSKAVAKQEGKVLSRGTAVDRNRARRRLKEAVRLAAPSAAQTHFDYVVIGRKAALQIKFAELLADMHFALHKVHQNHGPALLRHEPRSP